MSISLVATRGFGNGTLVGDINKTVTYGYSIAEQVQLIGRLVGELEVVYKFNGVLVSSVKLSGISKAETELNGDLSVL